MSNILNRRTATRSLIAALPPLLIGLTACTDDTRVTLHEAHTYKGNIDPHQNDQATRTLALKRRFQQVFPDR